MQKMATQQSTAAAFALSAGTKLLLIGLNAATGIITARALAPEGRGELAAIILWYTFLASAFTFGIPTALTYRIRQNPDESSRIAGAALVLTVFISIVISVAAVVGIPHWIPQYPSSVIFFARLYVLNTPVAAFLVTARAAVEGKGDFRASNLSLLGPPLLTLLGLAILGVDHQLSPASAGACYVLSGLPSVVWIAHKYLRLLKPQFDSFCDSVSLLMSYGIRSYGIDLCGTMSMYVDQALVVRILRPGMMGTYVVALSLSRMLNAFHTAVVMVLFPKAVSRSAAEVLELTSRAMRMTTFVTTVCGVGIVLAGPKLLVMLYGAQYRDASSVLRILVLEVILSGATQVMSQAFMALGRPGVITILQIIGLAMTVPMMLVLVPRMGIVGAGLALLVSTSARFIFVVFSFSRFLEMPAPRLILALTDLQYMGSCALRVIRDLGFAERGSEA